MERNTRIAKELVRIARMLVADGKTYDIVMKRGTMPCVKFNGGTESDIKDVCRDIEDKCGSLSSDGTFHIWWDHKINEVKNALKNHGWTPSGNDEDEKQKTEKMDAYIYLEDRGYTSSCWVSFSKGNESRERELCEGMAKQGLGKAEPDYQRRTWTMTITDRSKAPEIVKYLEEHNCEIKENDLAK